MSTDNTKNEEGHVIGEIKFSKYDDGGVFVIMAEGSTQGPIILEVEGEFTSYQSALDRSRKSHWIRTCICRVIPVSGNELLALDMERIQK